MWNKLNKKIDVCGVGKLTILGIHEGMETGILVYSKLYFSV